MGWATHQQASNKKTVACCGWLGQKLRKTWKKLLLSLIFLFLKLICFIKLQLVRIYLGLICSKMEVGRFVFPEDKGILNVHIC